MRLAARPVRFFMTQPQVHPSHLTGQLYDQASQGVQLTVFAAKFVLGHVLTEVRFKTSTKEFADHHSEAPAAHSWL